MKPTRTDVIAALDAIEASERPADHPRKLAQQAITQHRRRSTQPTLTQARIDSGSETEERRRRFVSASVKWSRRSLWARLFRR